MPRVGALEDAHARVAAQARVELPVADVDGHHLARARLEQAVREAAGRGPEVEAAPARRVHSEIRQRAGELLAAAGGEAPRLPTQAQPRPRADPRPRLLDRDLV